MLFVIGYDSYYWTSQLNIDQMVGLSFIVALCLINIQVGGSFTAPTGVDPWPVEACFLSVPFTNSPSSLVPPNCNSMQRTPRHFQDWYILSSRLCPGAIQTFDTQRWMELAPPTKICPILEQKKVSYGIINWRQWIIHLRTEVKCSTGRCEASN